MSLDKVQEQFRSDDSSKQASTTSSSGGGINNKSPKKKVTNSMSSSAHRVVGSAVPSMTKPTLIEVKPMRFLIMDAPRQSNLHVYIKEMGKHHVTDVVRVCEPTYHAGSELDNAGICLHEMGYQDGTSPSKELILAWLQLVDKTFYQPPSQAAAATPSDAAPCIAVHCVAGLGRAPVLVAIALIEFANMDPVEAVSFIRQRRRGAINEKQLLYLEGYKKQYKRSGGGGGAEGACCVIL